MEKNNLKKDYYVVDIMHILKSLWHRIWVVAVSAILCAAVGFSLAAFVITPKYSSSTMLYVNNTDISDKLGISISSSDIAAAQSLVKTYSVLLKNRTTLEKVIEGVEEVKGKDVEYDWEDLYHMIEVASVDDTQIMQITVTTEDPYEAQTIASVVGEVLEDRGETIIDGARIEGVDDAHFEGDKVSPGVTNYTVIGGAVGVVIALIVLVIMALMDNTIHDEDYVLQNYEYPILAKIPDLNGTGSKRYGYNRYAYYYKNGAAQDGDKK